MRSIKFMIVGLLLTVIALTAAVLSAASFFQLRGQLVGAWKNPHGSRQTATPGGSPNGWTPAGA